MKPEGSAFERDEQGANKLFHTFADAPSGDVVLIVVREEREEKGVNPYGPVVEGARGEDRAHNASPILQLFEGAGENIVDREVVIIKFPTHQDAEILKVVNDFYPIPVKEADSSSDPSVREERSEQFRLVMVDP